MATLRRLFLRHRRVAALLLALALCLKAMVPAGYMVEASGAVLTVTICDGQSNRVVEIALPGKKDTSHQERAQQATHCPYASMAFGAPMPLDPWLLAAALAFILLLGFAPLVPPVLPRLTHQRPPLRGPPVSA